MITTLSWLPIGDSDANAVRGAGEDPDINVPLLVEREQAGAA